MAAVDHLGTTLSRQLGRAHHEIFLPMGLDRVLDGHLVLARQRQVLIDVAARIDHCRFTFVADEVGDMGNAGCLNAFENHCLMLWFLPKQACRTAPMLMPAYFHRCVQQLLMEALEKARKAFKLRLCPRLDVRGICTKKPISQTSKPCRGYAFDCLAKSASSACAVNADSY